MVVIRLSRRGSKKRPFYHIVVADSKRAVQGKFLEKIGYYDPLVSGYQSLELELDRLDYWVGVGAQASDAVKSLTKKAKKKQALNLASIDSPSLADSVNSPVEA